MGDEASTTPEEMPRFAGLIALLLCAYFPMLGLFGMGVALPQLAAAYADDPNAVFLAQMIGGASGFSFAISSPILGLLIERFGYRAVYTASLIGFAVLGALPALLDSLTIILAVRLLFGIAVAGTITAGMAGLGTLPADVRPRLFGRNAMTSSLGAIVTFPTVGALAAISWRYPFVLHLLSLFVVPLALTLPRSGGRKQRLAEAQGSARSIGVSPALLLMAAFIGLTMYVGPMFSPFYLHVLDVTNPVLAALPLSGMSLAAILATGNFGRLHRRFGSLPLFGTILALVGCGLIAAGLAPSLLVFTLGMMLLSLGQAMFTPNLGSYISVHSPTPARDLGFAMSAMFAVQLVFPIVASGLSRIAGVAGVFFVFGGIALAAATGFVVLLGRSTGRARRPVRIQ